MKFILLPFVCLLFVQTIYAQEIQVLEKESRVPIPGVTIYNETKSIVVITDFDGKASLHSFSDSENIEEVNQMLQEVNGQLQSFNTKS